MTDKIETPPDHWTWTTHTADDQCTVGPDGVCTGCGATHAAPCPSCGGAAYHRPGCDGLVEQLGTYQPEIMVIGPNLARRAAKLLDPTVRQVPTASVVEVDGAGSRVVAGLCARCLAPINGGDMLAIDRNGLAIHATCPVDAMNKLNAAAIDAERYLAGLK